MCNALSTRKCCRCESRLQWDVDRRQPVAGHRVLALYARGTSHNSRCPAGHQLQCTCIQRGALQNDSGALLLVVLTHAVSTHLAVRLYCIARYRYLIPRCWSQITSAVTTTVIGEAKIIGLMALSALLLGVASSLAACPLTGDEQAAVWGAPHASLAMV